MEALRAMHLKGLIHRDINPNNLMKNPQTGDLCVIDFDLATTYVPNTYLYEVGTSGYIAPELIQHEKISYSSENYEQAFKTDVYSSGITLLRFILPHLISSSNGKNNNKITNVSNNTTLLSHHRHLLELWKTDPLEAVHQSVQPLQSYLDRSNY